MSLKKELLSIIPADEANAMTSAALFNESIEAETAEQIAKTLSAMHTEGIVSRSKNMVGKNQYWLNLNEQAKINTSPPADDDYAVPTFLLKTHLHAQKVDGHTLIDGIVAKSQGIELPKTIDINDNTAKTDSIQAVKSTLDTPFKLAITSDKTLILFGLSYQPIELSKAQTTALSDFCRELDLEAFLT